MTQIEWRETLAWAKDRFWSTLDIRPGMAEVLFDRLSYFPMQSVRRGIQEYAFENSGKRFAGDGLWKFVERRCRDERRSTPDSEVENEHGHTEAVRANIAREVRRRRENLPDYVDLSGMTNAQAYECFLRINRYIDSYEYPGHKYYACSWLNPEGPGPRTEEQVWCGVSGKSPREFRMKTLKPAPVRTVFDFVAAGRGRT